MKIYIAQTLPNGQVTQQVLSKEGGEPLKIQVQPGAKISFNVEGVKPADVANTKVKTGNIKKTGNNLVLESEGEALVEVTDFYSTAGASLGDVGWNYAVVDAGATAVTPEAQALSSDAAVSESGALFPAIASGWLLAGGAATVAAVASGGSSSAATVAGNIVSGVIVAGPVVEDHGLSVVLRKADGATLLGTAIVDASGKFSLDVGSYSGVIIAEVVDAGVGADYKDEASGLGVNLSAKLMAVGVMTGGSLKLNINPLTSIAAQMAGLEADGTGFVATAAEANEANAAVASAFGLTDITQTDPDTTNDSVAGTNAIGAVLAALSGLDAQNGNAQTTIDNFVAGITQTGAVGVLTAPAQTAALQGAAIADPAGTLGLVNKISDSMSAAVITTGFSVGDVATDNIIKTADALTTTTTITGTVATGTLLADLDLKIGGVASANNAGFALVGTTWTYTLSAADVTALTTGADGALAIELTVAGVTKGQRMVLKDMTDDAPSAVIFLNPLASISESSDNTSGTKLADINIADIDGYVGVTPTVSNGANFEVRPVDGKYELWLKSGVSIDYEAVVGQALSTTVTAGGTTSQTFTLAIANVNEAPTVANAIADQSATEDAGFSYQIPANAFADVDGDTLSYNASGLPAGLSFDPGARTISGTPTTPGASTVTITANDGNGGTVTDQFTITVANIDDAGTIAAISGTATQGQILTAGAITDADGGVTSITYQWKADGTNISGATGSTYTLTQADVGKAITVVANYTDAQGSGKSVTSAATSAVVGVGDQVGTIAAISGTATQGQILTAGAITDADGGVTSITYQWKADGTNISGATGSTYTLTQADVGKAITVVANYTDAQGSGKSVTSAATSAVANIDDAGTIAAISGTATQGQILTAGAITDADGGVTSITYQWKADGTNISGATGSTYTLTQADVGKAITVVANYTDAHGPGKSVTSAATSAVANIDDAGTIAAISGTATQGQILTAGAITDADGGVTSITYQWKADGTNISGATGSTYTLTQADVGKAITVVANYTDAQGSGKSVTSAATSAVANIDDAGTIAAISGTATQGQILTAGAITDADGGVTSITYQWKADGTNISGATGSTYTLTQADVGKAITVVANYTDAQGSGKSVTSAATSAVANIDDAGTIAAISGTATQGQILTAGAITDADGGVTSITYQWKADGTNISGATGSTYTLTQADVGKAITVVANYTDAHGPGKSVTSAATSAVANIDDAGTIAAISGTATQGQILTAGAITDADGGVTSITYQWKADGTNISGATGSTYTLTQADVGKAITVVANYTDAQGSGKSVTSAATSAVANIDDAGTIAAISGTATQGQILTAGAITDADGGVTSITYQWKADGTNISGATGSTYTLTQADVGKAITVVANYTDAQGSGKSVTSAATSAVVGVGDQVGTIAAISGTATQGQILTAGAITDADGGVTSITYQWKADGTNISGATGSTYTLTQADVGKAITVVANYTDAQGSGKSVTSAATSAVANIDDAGTIAAISGTATQGQILTAGAITDADGGVTSITYQWKADGTNISGATGSTYTLTQADVGKAITVVANYTDAQGSGKSVTSAATSAVANIDDAGTIAAISGTATQGQILTAGAITDADGGVTSITYQWKADGTNISGATGSTYTLTQADVGKAITVVANYTDAQGSGKSVTSAATSAVANIDDAGTIAAISGTATQGQILTAGAITDADGGVTSITYQWKADGTNISGATGSTYTLTQADVGKAITVVANYTDAQGSGKSVTSAATSAVANIDDAGTIAAISGTATQGQILTAGAITDADGGVTSITYQWKADGTNISGATGSTYTLTQADVGKAITVVANYTDAHGPGKSVTSAATSAVANIDDAGTIAAISGTATQGQILTAGAITDADGGVTSITYQWKADGTNISGATGSTYTLTQADVGKAITVVANYTDAQGSGKSVTSAATSAVANIDDAGTIAAISGTATQGQILTAGAITDADGGVTSITYQWKADGTNISGATGSTYTLTQADVGKAITVVANYTDAQGSGKSVTSAATSAVANIDDAGTIAAISGTATQGQILTAGAITDADGGVTSITYQWKADGTNISGATGSTYTLTQADVGKAITVVANYTDAQGSGKSVTSAATSAVANIDDAGTIAAISGTATQGQILTAGAITDADGGVTSITYQWKADGTNISGATGSTYTLTQADVGKAITVVANYTDAHGPGKSVTSVATSAVAPNNPELLATQTLDNVTNLDVRSALVLAFNQNIALGSGKIKIFDDSNTTGWTHKNWATGETVAETRDNDIEITLVNGAVTAVSIAGVDSSARFNLAGSVITNGSNLVIDLKQLLSSGPGASAGNTNTTSSTTTITRTAFDWDFGSDYHIEFDAGIVTSSTNASLTNTALSDTSTLNFKTVTPTASSSAATAAAASQIMDATGGSTGLSAGMSWISGNQGEWTSAARVIDMAQGSGSIAVVMDSNGGTSRSGGLSGNVQLNNFNIDDLLYLDNHGDLTLLTTNGLGAQNAANWAGGSLRTLTNTGSTSGSTYLTMFSDAGTTAVMTSLGDSGIEAANKFGTHAAKDLVIFG